MGRRGRLAPWVALLLVGCARNNPEFGLDDGADTAADGGEDSTRGDDGPVTQGSDGDTTAGGGSASNGTTDPVIPETSTSGGLDTDSGTADGTEETGTEPPCEKVQIDVITDTFVDGTDSCAGTCAGLNFGGSGMRLVGSESTGGGPSSVYLMEFVPTQIPATRMLSGAHLHIPLTAVPDIGAVAMAFPLEHVPVWGDSNQATQTGASTWSHRLFMDQTWDDPLGGPSGDFGVVLTWAIMSNALIEQPLLVDDLVQGAGAPAWVEVDIVGNNLLALQLALQDGAEIRMGFTIDSLLAQWPVRAREGDGIPAFLEVEVCP